MDSSASLYKLDGIDFASVPLKIVTDEREYLDDGTLDAVEMATALRTYKGKTSTSCPNVVDWLSAYEGAEQLVVIPITGTLSGSFNAALLAGEEYGAEWCCAGAISRKGHPHHPLYLRKDEKLRPFDVKAYLEQL